MWHVRSAYGIQIGYQKVVWDKDISVPTLLLAGPLMENHPSVAMKDLEERLLNVQKVIPQGQGHSANLEAPEMIAKAVSGFLKENAR